MYITSTDAAVRSEFSNSSVWSHPSPEIIGSVRSGGLKSHWSALCHQKGYGEQHGGHHFATVENFVGPAFGILCVALVFTSKGHGEDK